MKPPNIRSARAIYLLQVAVRTAITNRTRQRVNSGLCIVNVLLSVPVAHKLSTNILDKILRDRVTDSIKQTPCKPLAPPPFIFPWSALLNKHKSYMCLPSDGANIFACVERPSLISSYQQPETISQECLWNGCWACHLYVDHRRGHLKIIETPRSAHKQIRPI